MATEIERISALETQAQTMTASLDCLWKEHNHLIREGCKNQREGCESKMAENTKALQDSIQKSWNSMITILKIFIPVCMILFTTLAGWAVIQQSKIAENAVAIRDVQKDVESNKEVNARILIVLERLDAKITK